MAALKKSAGIGCRSFHTNAIGQVTLDAVQNATVVVGSGLHDLAKLLGLHIETVAEACVAALCQALFEFRAYRLELSPELVGQGRLQFVELLLGKNFVVT